MWVLRQSTASQEIPLGPFVDSTDGNTAETGLTIANTDIKLQKNGATSQANKNSGGATHIATGDYYAVLDATDTDTVGPMRVKVHVAGALPVWLDCVVLEEAVYDALYAASATAFDANGRVLLQPTQTGVTIPTVTTLTGHTPQTGDSYARIGANGAGLTAVDDAVLTAIAALNNLSLAQLQAAAGIVAAGTLQSATATTAVLASATSFADDLINEATIVITGGTGAGQSRTIDDWVSSTDTATVETWTTTPDNTSTYYVYATPPGATGGGGGLDAAGVRAAIGLASANLDTQLATIDTVVDAILVDTGTTLDDLIDTEITAIQSSLTTLATAVDTIDNLLDTEMPALTTAVAALQTSVNTVDDLLDTEMPALTSAVASLATAVNTIDDLLDTEVAALTTAVADIPTNAELATALDAIPTAAENAAAVLTAADSNPIAANIQEINDVTIVGDGDGTPFNV